MAVVGAITLLGLWTAFLLFPVLKLPSFLCTTATVLLTAEFLALLVHSYGTEGCAPAGCSVITATAGTMASQDVPALAALLYVLAVSHGLRAQLTTRSR